MSWFIVTDGGRGAGAVPPQPRGLITWILIRVAAPRVCACCCHAYRWLRSFQKHLYHQ